MKSLKELQNKNRKLLKIVDSDAEKMSHELGPEPYPTFYELGPLDLLDFLLIPSKIKSRLQKIRYEPIKQKT